MPYLLDTHAFLWWIDDDMRLSARARAVIRDPDTEIFFSAASAWEIAIKARLGRIQLQRDLLTFIPQQIAVNSFRTLPIDLPHALHVSTLAPLHRDPFDRMLIAQAQIERMPLITADRLISQYAVETVW